MPSRTGAEVAEKNVRGRQGSNPRESRSPGATVGAQFVDGVRCQASRLGHCLRRVRHTEHTEHEPRLSPRGPLTPRNLPPRDPPVGGRMRWTGDNRFKFVLKTQLGRLRAILQASHAATTAGALRKNGFATVSDARTGQFELQVQDPNTCDWNLRISRPHRRSRSPTKSATVTPQPCAAGLAGRGAAADLGHRIARRIPERGDSPQHGNLTSRRAYCCSCQPVQHQRYRRGVLRSRTDDQEPLPIGSKIPADGTGTNSGVHDFRLEQHLRIAGVEHGPGINRHGHHLRVR